MVGITKMLLSNIKANPGIGLKRLKYIVLHYTGNYNVGADAVANREYFNTVREENTSAHYIVDDKQIVQCVEDHNIAYHVGAKQYTSLGKSIMAGDIYSPNYYTIGIEMCVNVDGDFEKMYRNTVKLVSLLLQKHKMTVENICRHFDITGKACPAFMLQDNDLKKFKNEVEKMSMKLVLKLNSKGSEVKELQSNLILLGYSVGVYGADGIFGNDTDRAVRQLQKDNKIGIDGIVGSQTYAVIGNLLNEKPPVVKPIKDVLKLNSVGESVKELQTKLNEIGYKLDVDGVFGGLTLDAVTSYQKANGLVTDGIVGEKTWEKLLSAVKPPIQIVNDYEAFKKDKYINVVKIRRDTIKKIDIVIAQNKNKLETLDNMYKRQLQKPIVMINGGLYFIDKITGEAKSLNLLFTDDITYAIGSYSKKGFLFYPDGNMSFGEFRYTKGVQMIGGSPTIIDNGKIVLDKGNMENSLIISRHPRTAIGMNDKYLFMLTIDGRRIGMPGMTINELSKYMLTELGCKYGIATDGGGSTKMIFDGKLFNSPIENRLLHNSLAVYI